MWRRQAESYSPVWPKGTPCPKPSLANACTLSWSMDDMLEALMGARAGWNEQIQNMGGHSRIYSHTHAHSHRQGTWEGSSTLQNIAEEQLWQPDITAAATLLHACDKHNRLKHWWTNTNSLKHWWTQLWMDRILTKVTAVRLVTDRTTVQDHYVGWGSLGYNMKGQTHTDTLTLIYLCSRIPENYKLSFRTNFRSSEGDSATIQTSLWNILSH